MQMARMTQQQVTAIVVGVVALAVLVLVGLYATHTISFVLMLALAFIVGGILLVLFLLSAVVAAVVAFAQVIRAKNTRTPKR